MTIGETSIRIIDIRNLIIQYSFPDILVCFYNIACT